VSLVLDLADLYILPPLLIHLREDIYYYYYYYYYYY